MNKLKTLLASLCLLLSLSVTALANDRLVGNWKGSNIQLNLKANHTYRYQVKVLSFTGKWSASKNTLTLNYSLLGLKKKKVATYHFKGDELVLRQKGKGAVTLKKQ